MKLPYVMIGIAFLAGIFAAGYIRMARRLPTSRLVFWSMLFFASNLVVFWWLAVRGVSWLYPVLYLWSGVFGVAGPTQVWTMASEVFTTREAKRLFGVVGAGGILGGTVGGILAYRLAPLIGTDHLLLVVAGMLVLAAVVVLLLARVGAGSRRATARDRTPPRSLSESLHVVTASSHLRLLAGLVFITAVATSSVDFQFNIVAEQSITERDALTSFFGAVYGGISIASFLVQILLTSRLMASAGVGFSILLLPLSLAMGTVALFASGALWAGVFLKGSDGSLKHSLDRSCRELMYLPVPNAVRLQAKSTIDTVMDRLGDGTAGVLQLMITAGLGLGLRSSLAANFLLVLVWLIIAVRLKLAYVAQLYQALGQRRRPDGEVAVESDADARRTLEKILRAGEGPEQVAVLEWVARNSIRVDEELLLGLIHEARAPEVRNAALGLLLSGDPGQLPPDLLAELEKEGQTVLVAAIDLLVEPEADRVQQRLEVLLDRAGETTRLSAVAFMLRRLGTEFEPFARKVFDTLLDESSPPHARAAAVRALALLPPESPIRHRVDEAVRDPEPVVVAAAAEVASRMSRSDLLPRLIRLLGLPDKRLAVRQGIVLFGDQAVPHLLAALRETDGQAEVRRQVPRLLGELATAPAVRALVAALDDGDAQVREAALRALRAIRRDMPEIRPVSAEWLETRLLEQVDAYEELLLVEQALRHDPQSGADGMLWLMDALESERFRILGRVFLLLALDYPVPEMARSWFAVRGGSPRERANALELLDNMLPKRLKSRLLGLLEPRGDRVARLWRGRRKEIDLRDAVARLVRGDDPWIGACALYAARDVGASGLAEVAREAAGSEYQVLREEAEAYLAAGESGGGT